MSNILNLQDDTRPASLNEIADLVDTAARETQDGSYLAGSLLELPGAFTISEASILIDQARFFITDENDADIANGLTTYRGCVSERIRNAATSDASVNLEDLTERENWELLVDIFSEDQDTAVHVFRETGQTAAQNSLREMPAVRLLLDELRAKSADPTPGQMMLLTAQDPGMRYVAGHAFPAAAEFMETLQADLVSDADRRRAERTRSAEREREYARNTLNVGGGLSALEQLELVLEDDPDTLAMVALNTSKKTAASTADLAALLAAASNEPAARWLAGFERATPLPEQIEAFAALVSNDRLREIGKRLNELEKEGHNLQVPWMGDIVQHVYVPTFHLAAPVAALVWQRLNEICEGDQALWLAMLTAFTNAEEPTRLQDV